MRTSRDKGSVVAVMRTSGRERAICHGLAAADYGPLLQMVADGTLPLGELITRRITLSESAAALQQMTAGSAPGVAVITDFTG